MPEFGKPADFSMILNIIDRGNSGEGNPAILEASALLPTDVADEYAETLESDSV